MSFKKKKNFRSKYKHKKQVNFFLNNIFATKNARIV